MGYLTIISSVKIQRISEICKLFKIPEECIFKDKDNFINTKLILSIYELPKNGNILISSILEEIYETHDGCLSNAFGNYTTKEIIMIKKRIPLIYHNFIHEFI